MFRAVSLIAILTVCFIARAAAQTPQESAFAAARMLGEGRFADLAQQFTPQMASALPPDRLAQTWQGLVAQAGPLRGTGTPREAQQGGFTIVTVPLQFERDVARPALGAFDKAIVKRSHGLI